MTFIKNRANARKGFTMTEIIVVLVIIAILAAMAIPALMGYIKDAKEKASLSMARNTFAQLNGVLLQNDTTKDSVCWAVVRWAKDNGEIKYDGPIDDASIKLKPPFSSYHDVAKHAIRTLMGGKPIPFGYRITLQQDSGTSYRIKTMEVFYVTPSNASINHSKPDIVFGDSK